MPTYNIKIVNQHFEQAATQTAPNDDKAWQLAIKSAIIIAAEQVSEGEQFFGAEVSLETDGRKLGRYVLSVGASHLKE